MRAFEPPVYCLQTLCGPPLSYTERGKLPKFICVYPRGKSFRLTCLPLSTQQSFVLWCQQQQQQLQQWHASAPPTHIAAASAAIAIAFVKFCVRRRICQIVCFVWRVQLLSNFFLCQLASSLSLAFFHFSFFPLFVCQVDNTQWHAP